MSQGDELNPDNDMPPEGDALEEGDNDAGPSRPKKKQCVE